MARSIADFTISSASSQYVRVPITATVSGATINPSNDTVQMAFVTVGEAPGTSDWRSSSWEAGTPWLARCLVHLSRGLYDVYVRVQDNPEIPVLYSGLLEVAP